MRNDSWLFPILALALLFILFLIILWDWFPTKDRYVSEMEYSVMKWEWFEPQKDRSVESNIMKIRDKSYFKGLGVHAETAIAVNVPSGYTHFVAEVGIDEKIAHDAPATVIFRVMGDGAILYESPVMMPDMAPRRIDISVADITQIILEALPTRDGTNSDHANWGNARFVAR